MKQIKKIFFEPKLTIFWVFASLIIIHLISSIIIFCYFNYHKGILINLTSKFTWAMIINFSLFFFLSFIVAIVYIQKLIRTRILESEKIFEILSKNNLPTDQNNYLEMITGLSINENFKNPSLIFSLDRGIIKINEEAKLLMLPNKEEFIRIITNLISNKIAYTKETFQDQNSYVIITQETLRKGMFIINLIDITTIVNYKKVVEHQISNKLQSLVTKIEMNKNIEQIHQEAMIDDIIDIRNFFGKREELININDLIMKFKQLMNHQNLNLHFKNKTSKKYLLSPNIICHALQNIILNNIQHSQASIINITFYNSKGHLCIKIENDGVGIGTKLSKNLNSNNFSIGIKVICDILSEHKTADGKIGKLLCETTAIGRLNFLIKLPNK